MFYLLLLLSCYLIFLASVESIELVTADLGRHITNGAFIIEAISKGLDLNTYTPLFKNFYSYTIPEQATMNHHWLSGVIFYFLFNLIGFDGLELINIFLIIAANLIFFIAAKEISNKNIALLAMIIAIPITCLRKEVRPESFSYLFMSLVFLLLVLFQHKKISKKVLFIAIPLIQLLWINMHLFFIFGLFTIAAFALSSWINKNKEDFKIISKVFIIAVLISLLNPAHILGLIEPLLIFKGFGYMIAENQSVFFMQVRSPNNPSYPYFEIIVLLALISSLISLFKNKTFALNLIILIPLSLAALKTNRIMPVAAFYLIPVLASSVFYLSNNINNQSIKKYFEKLIIGLSIFLLVFFIWVYYYYWGNRIDHYKFNPAINGSAQFISQNNVPQPVFNNFDIGGYYIFHLFPKYRPYVDNRPEAYKKEFFDNYYNPLLQFENKWQEMDKEINFQTIYFMRNDATEFAQPFLIRRLEDPSWVPVFVDNWTIILVKRNSQNENLIKQYQLPKQMFKAVAS